MKRNKSHVKTSNFIKLSSAFLAGCVLCSSFFLYIGVHQKEHAPIISNTHQHPINKINMPASAEITASLTNYQSLFNKKNSNSTLSSLRGLKLLVAITSFDFSQVPHLEEVLDSYRDVCEAGAFVDVVIYTTVPYPVIFIDLLNSRLQCSNKDASFQIKIVVKSPRLRLHLVDCHRTLFYEKIDDYDLFVYTEDDIRVRTTTIAAYLQETKKVKQIVGAEKQSDYNIGIVRYEYNFPPDIVIDDKTRSATANVTRVYWEHLGRPIFDRIATELLDDSSSEMKKNYLTMKNHHQGMFIATSHLLKEWKTRPGCQFDVIRDRPGMKKNPGQHTEGTQRVWMSSNMLFGKRHCNVRQLLPIDSFGSLTVLHLPNKNYRRVGKAGRLGGNQKDAKKNKFGDGTEVFEGPSKELIPELEFHVAVRKTFRKVSSKYNGVVTMVDELLASDGFLSKEYRHLFNELMEKYQNYVARGGVLIDADMFSFDLYDHIGAFYEIFKKMRI